MGLPASELAPAVEADGALLAALQDRCGDSLQPLAAWVASGSISLPDGDHLRQRWWAARIQAAQKRAVMDAAAGRDVAHLEAISAGKV